MQMARLRLSCCPVLAWQIHANRQDAVVWGLKGPWVKLIDNKFGFSIFGVHDQIWWAMGEWADWWLLLSCTFSIQFTPLLNGPISKNHDQRSGILHIVRDPKGYPKMLSVKSESSVFRRKTPFFDLWKNAKPALWITKYLDSGMNSDLFKKINIKLDMFWLLQVTIF